MAKQLSVRRCSTRPPLSFAFYILSFVEFFDLRNLTFCNIRCCMLILCFRIYCKVNYYSPERRCTRAILVSKAAGISITFEELFVEVLEKGVFQALWVLLLVILLTSFFEAATSLMMLCEVMGAPADDSLHHFLWSAALWKLWQLCFPYLNRIVKSKFEYSRNPSFFGMLGKAWRPVGLEK